MSVFLYDPVRQSLAARELSRDELIDQLKALPDTQDLFVALLREEHDPESYSRALRRLGEHRELPATAGGFVPQDGPWWPDHNSGATPPNPSHGAFQIHDALSSGSVLGQLLMIPVDYTPLSGTSWIGREYWRWTDSSWPDTFYLKAQTLSSGASSAWTGYTHGVFSAPSGTVDPSDGKLYEIRRILQSEGPPGDRIGALWRKPGGDLLWFALEGSVEANGLFAWPANSAMSFVKLSSVPSGIDDMWRRSAPKVYP